MVWSCLYIFVGTLSKGSGLEYLKQPRGWNHAVWGFGRRALWTWSGGLLVHVKVGPALQILLTGNIYFCFRKCCPCKGENPFHTAACIKCPRIHIFPTFCEMWAWGSNWGKTLDCPRSVFWGNDLLYSLYMLFQVQKQCRSLAVQFVGKGGRIWMIWNKWKVTFLLVYMYEKKLAIICVQNSATPLT